MGPARLHLPRPLPCWRGQDPPHHGHVTVQKVSVPIPRTAPTHTQWGYPREHQGRRSPSPQPCTHRCQGRPPQHSRVLAGHCALITSEQLLSWMLRCSGPHEPPDTELQRKPNLRLLHSPSKSNCFGNESVVWIFAVFLLKRVRRKAPNNNFSTSLTEHN